MHFDNPPPTTTTADDGPWYKDLNRYHWFVLLVSALGWMFDCLDQQLFNLARAPAIRELMGASSPDLQFYGGLATTIFIVGWATGGIIFGILGDRIGRAKTMVLTILVYSLFTGLSSISTTFVDFAFYRFLTGLGVGGEFAVGIALVAEVMPDRARPHALGWLQALSAVGNITAAFISMALAPFETAGTFGAVQPWRIMFVIGALPALLALFVRRRLKEPERWVALKTGQVHGQQLGSIREMFGNPVLRRNAIIGLLLAVPGVVGLWAIGFFSFDLVRVVFRKQFENEVRIEAKAPDQSFVRLLAHDPKAAEKFTTRNDKEEAGTRIDLAIKRVKPANLLEPDAKTLYQAIVDLAKDDKSVTVRDILGQANKKGDLSTADQDRLRQMLETQPSTEAFPSVFDSITQRTQAIDGRLTLWAGINGLLFNIGAFFGIYSFSKITHRVGRKPAFFVTFLLALGSTAFTFWNLDQLSDIFWMVPVMGFCQIALFGGYAIYFPELFPTRLRSTGTSFCYNVGRYVAAPGPMVLGMLASYVFGHHEEAMRLRLAGVTMCSFFLLGLVALPFAPETKGKPLPE